MGKVALIGNAPKLLPLLEGLAHHHLLLIDQFNNQAQGWLQIPLRNFHDLTIELIEFSPDVVVYLPEGEDHESQEIAFVELINHLKESMISVNPHFVVLLTVSKGELVEESISVLTGIKKHTVLNFHQSQLEHRLSEVIKGRIYGILTM
ncbi:MAG: hypothetical protein ACXAE3_08465 [Candidatus Kariarchaeaceae archaeon]|jgi:hypothetical protein